jgi:hypothetical protein
MNSILQFLQSLAPLLFFLSALLFLCNQKRPGKMILERSIKFRIILPIIIILITVLYQKFFKN